MTTADVAPPHGCEHFLTALADGDVPLGYSDRFREHVLRIGEDGSTRGMLLLFCPFCGSGLPPSVRAEWAAEVAARGFTPTSDDLPTDLRSGAWWRAQGL